MRRVALVALMMLLAGCGNDLRGEVSKKEYERAYSYVTMDTVDSCSTDPSTGARRCTTTTVPRTVYVPECYRIHVKGEESGSACVSPTEYEEIEVGDYYEGPDVKPEDRRR